MRILLAILLPPLLFLVQLRPIEAIISFLLCLTGIGWPLSSIWAVIVVFQDDSAKRHKETMKALQRTSP